MSAKESAPPALPASAGSLSQEEREKAEHSGNLARQPDTGVSGIQTALIRGWARHPNRRKPVRALVVDAVTFRENDGPDVLRFVLVGEQEIRANGEKRDRGMVVELPSIVLGKLIEQMGQPAFNRMVDRAWTAHTLATETPAIADAKEAEAFEQLFRPFSAEVPK